MRVRRIIYLHTYDEIINQQSERDMLLIGVLSLALHLCAFFIGEKYELASLLI